MYRNFVFDIGGVVVNYNPKDFLATRFFNERIEKKLYDAVFGSAEWELLDRGEITWSEAKQIFLRRGAQRDMAIEMQALLDEWVDIFTTNRATVTLMRLLKKKGFNLYYLSNISKETFYYLSGRRFWRYFDGGIASFELGICKPDPRIYEELIAKYELVPEETIFTDDDKENSLAAFEAGITGIQFRNVQSLCKMLVQYGIDV